MSGWWTRNLFNAVLEELRVQPKSEGAMRELTLRPGWAARMSGHFLCRKGRRGEPKSRRPRSETANSEGAKEGEIPRPKDEGAKEGRDPKSEGARRAG